MTFADLQIGAIFRAVNSPLYPHSIKRQKTSKTHANAFGYGESMVGMDVEIETIDDPFAVFSTAELLAELVRRDKEGAK